MDKNLIETFQQKKNCMHIWRAHKLNKNVSICYWRIFLLEILDWKSIREFTMIFV